MPNHADDGRWHKPINAFATPHALPYLCAADGVEGSVDELDV